MIDEFSQQNYFKCFIKHTPLNYRRVHILTYKYFSYLFTYLHPLIPPYFPRSEIDRNKARFSPSVASFFPSFVDSERKKKNHMKCEKNQYVLQQLSRIIFPSSMHIHIRSVIHYYRLGVPLAKRGNKGTFFSLLDNAPNQIVGCIIQKRLFSQILKLLKLPK